MQSLAKTTLSELQFPVVSQQLTVGPIAIPTIWMRVVVSYALLSLFTFAPYLPFCPKFLIVWFQIDTTHHSPGPLVLSHPITVTVFLMITVCFVTGLIGVLCVHRRACTRVYLDRIELDEVQSDHRIFYWKNIVRDPDAKADVWMARIGSGKGSYTMIAFRYAEEGQVVATHYLHSNLHPEHRWDCSYVNKSGLRQAFILALLLTRPDLRITDEVWEMCEVNPANLNPDARPKLFEYFIYFLFAVELLWVFLYIPYMKPESKFLRISLIYVTSMLCMCFSLCWLKNRLFLRANDPRSVACRQGVLQQIAERITARPMQP